MEFSLRTPCTGVLEAAVFTGKTTSAAALRAGWTVPAAVFFASHWTPVGLGFMIQGKDMVSP
jgi:hypothetical protein